MNILMKGIITAVIAILLISYIFIAAYQEPVDEDVNQDTTDDQDQNNEDNNQDDPDENDDTDDSNEDIDQTQYTLVEEGTATWCTNCPEVAHGLHDLYESGNSNFYYIAFVEDENTKAKSRLEDDYNINGYPTVYIDGGYKVLRGSQKFSSNFESSLAQTKARNRPDLIFTLDSEYNETRNEIKNSIYIKNQESSSYRGTVRIYITEIRSRWVDYEADPYSYAFIDYGLVEDINIDANKNLTIEKVWKAQDAGFADIIPENIFLIGAIFSDEKNTAYSYPEESDFAFDAYYVDSVVGTNISEAGELPPSIGITSPKQYKRYILGNELGSTFTGKTRIIGKTTLSIKTTAEAGIKKVEYDISGPINSITEEVTSPPYDYSWDSFALGKYTITVTITDNQDRKATDSIEVSAFILGLL